MSPDLQAALDALVRPHVSPDGRPVVACCPADRPRYVAGARAAARCVACGALCWVSPKILGVLGGYIVACSVCIGPELMHRLCEEFLAQRRAESRGLS